MIKSVRVVANTTPVKLNIDESIDSLVGQVVAIKNIDSANTAYLGGVDVTTSNGFPVAPGEQIAFEMSVVQDLYAVAGSATNLSILLLDVK